MTRTYNKDWNKDTKTSEDFLLHPSLYAFFSALDKIHVAHFGGIKCDKTSTRGHITTVISVYSTVNMNVLKFNDELGQNRQYMACWPGNLLGFQAMFCYVAMYGAISQALPINGAIVNSAFMKNVPGNISIC